MTEPTILYEDRDVIVINKPAGLIVHSDGRTVESSVADWVVGLHPEMKGVGEPWTSPQGEVVDRPGIVHRLDRTTSGVMIIAKTQLAYEFLKSQFQDRTTEKVYRALVYGAPKKDKGTIEAEIARLRSTPPRWSATLKGVVNKKRAAVTDWAVLKRGKTETGDVVSVIEARPKTGRTHQIRVHLKALGYPIICDPLYAPTKVCILGMGRVALHAASLTINLPSGERQTFVAPLAADMAAAEAALGEFADRD
jgi:23S rRNA pseudouridine1911/1915/1917 synthase